MKEREAGEVRRETQEEEEEEEEEGLFKADAVNEEDPGGGLAVSDLFPLGHFDTLIYTGYAGSSAREIAVVDG